MHHSRMNQFRSSPEARERWDRYWRAGGYEDFSDFVRRSLDAALALKTPPISAAPPPPAAVHHIGRPETGHHPACGCSTCVPPAAA